MQESKEYTLFLKWSVHKSLPTLCLPLQVHPSPASFEIVVLISFLVFVATSNTYIKRQTEGCLQTLQCILFHYMGVALFTSFSAVCSSSFSLSLSLASCMKYLKVHLLLTFFIFLFFFCLAMIKFIVDHYGYTLIKKNERWLKVKNFLFKGYRIDCILGQLLYL